MTIIRNSVIALTFFIAANAAVAGDPHGHDEDVVVGITGASQLAVEFDPSEILDLPEILLGPLSGWGIDDPGFLSLEADEPVEDFFVLGAGADIRYEVVSFDAALKGHTQGFASIFDDAGEFFELGSPDFDEHPFWQIDSADPGFDPGQATWQATGRLVDVGTTGYAPSDPFTLTFRPVPEPGSLALLATGLAVHVRRRRSLDRVW